MIYCAKIYAWAEVNARSAPIDNAEDYSVVRMTPAEHSSSVSIDQISKIGYLNEERMSSRFERLIRIISSECETSGFANHGERNTGSSLSRYLPGSLCSATIEHLSIRSNSLSSIHTARHLPFSSKFTLRSKLFGSEINTFPSWWHW